MRVRDYLKQVSGNVTFIIVGIEKHDSIKDYYTSVYRTTPIRAAWEWEESTSDLLDMIVVNKDCHPIDETDVWHNQYKRGDLKCCMVTREETIRTRYSERQAEMMLAFYEKKMK